MSGYCRLSKNVVVPPCFRNAAEQHVLGHSSSSSIKKYMSARFESCHDLYRVDLRGHYGCVNAIEFSNNGGEFVVSGGDDRRVLLWNIDKTLYRQEEPIVMKGQHRSNIFCTVFDGDNRHLFSAGNDDQAIRHDILTRETLGVYFHDHPVYSLNVHPDQENVFLTACDNGKVLLWDARNTSQNSSQCIADYHRSIAFHAAVFNPVDPVLVATANSSKGVQLWDIRSPKSVLHEYSSSMSKVCAMGVKWNATGTLLSALRRRLPPVLYNIQQTSALVEFKHPGYNNICTMKSHCFAGTKDQYIISGSDDFNVYIWKVPDLPSNKEKMLTVDSAKMVLSGHRSIVNQVRFNPATHMIISAGVEKIVKVWSPWHLPGAKGTIHKSRQGDESKRELYSHDDYVDLVLDSGRPLTHEYEGGSIEEDPRMLAFFDTLIQREHGGWNSESDSNYSEDDFYANYLVRSSEDSETDMEQRSAQQIRDLTQETRDSEESDDTSQAVLRRVRRLRRAAFLRRLVRGAERQVDEDEQHPSNTQNAFLRHLTREIMREALETSSDSSDSEPTITLALPEELQSDNNEENEPVQFNRSRTHQRRQYRRRSSSHESNPSSSAANINNNETDSPVRNSRRRRESSSSSSEDDNHEDECRISYVHDKRTKRRRQLDESDNEQNNDELPNNHSINEPSTSSSALSFTHENQTFERHSYSSTDFSTNESRPFERHSNLSDGTSNNRLNNSNSNVHEPMSGESTGCRADIQDSHETNVNHNGHKTDGHNNHNTKPHYPLEDNKTTLENNQEDLRTQ